MSKDPNDDEVYLSVIHVNKYANVGIDWCGQIVCLTEINHIQLLSQRYHKSDAKDKLGETNMIQQNDKLI